MAPYYLAIRRAEALLAAGNGAGAIEPLRDALTAAPDEAYPHLLLSRALRGQRRLEGARYEAERAVALQPLWSAAHLELAVTLAAQQHRRAALAAVDYAIELDPEDAHAHLFRANMLRQTGRRADAQDSLAQALALEPANPDVLAERGYAALERDATGEVEAAAREILSLNPDHSDGLVLAGHARLAGGDGDEALRLALAALANAPNDLDALSLFAAVKMKRSFLGGLWWRWNRLLIKLGQARAIFFVVGLWVLYRMLALAMGDLGAPPDAQTILTGVYFAFVLYTLSADVVVTRMIAKEVEKVRLRPSF